MMQSWIVKEAATSNVIKAEESGNGLLLYLPAPEYNALTTVHTGKTDAL